MNECQVIMWVVGGICMFFVGRTIGYREAVGELQSILMECIQVKMAASDD